MSEFKIEKGIPFANGRAGSKYPFRGMEIGDSFFIPGGHVNGIQKNSADQWVRRVKNGWKFSARTTIENDVRGCRIWRVA